MSNIDIIKRELVNDAATGLKRGYGAMTSQAVTDQTANPQTEGATD